MTTEFNAFFGNVAEFLEAPDLKSAAVGKHRAVPAHKFLNAAHLGHQFRTRAQVKVVRIRENNLRLHFAQVPRRKPLHARKCPHRHKNRRFDGTVGSVKPAAAGLALIACLDEFKRVLVHDSKIEKRHDFSWRCLKVLGFRLTVRTQADELLSTMDR